MRRRTGPLLSVVVVALLSGLAIGCGASQSQRTPASSITTPEAGALTDADLDEFPHGALWILESINGSPLHSDSYITITVDRTSYTDMTTAIASQVSLGMRPCCPQ